MRFRPATVRAMRDQLSGVQGVTPDAASRAPVVFWPGGIIYYNFASNVTAVHQQAFLDAAAEWAAWAKLTFTPAGVGQADYVTVNDGGASLSGGNSFVGVKGGQQFVNIGSTSWNRGTLVHEIGHVLGFIHEHQRSDRDKYVKIIPANSTQNDPPANTGGPNLILLTDSTNKGAYDFESIMHYARNAFSVNPTPSDPNLPDPSSDTIEPLAADIQFLNVMGRETDRTLSTLDRAAVAQLYGAPAVAPGLTVTNTRDGGPGSLRTAIYYALDRSVSVVGSTNTITFHIPTTDPGYSGGVFTIPLTYQLTAPADGTIIDGTTQTAFTGDTNANGPEIALNGAGVLASEFLYASGLRLRAANCSVKGLTIENFNNQGITIFGNPATNNVVQGCFVGTNPAGTAAAANAYAGIEIYGGAQGNTVGGTNAAARNVIAGNLAQGVYIHDGGTSDNLVKGNYLGTNATGTAALANTYSGIEIGFGATSNMVGGALAGNGNLISGNKYQGVYIHGAGTTSNTVQGNYLGTNAAGAAAVGNGFADTVNHVFAAGVQIGGGAASNTVGGASIAARNVIVGNAAGGVVIDGAGTTGNAVLGNYVGLNAAGTAALANGAADPANNYNYSGVAIYGGAASNAIGGTSGGAGNVISGNAAQGITLSDAGTTGNLVAGNILGLNPAGTAKIGNGYAGISIFGGATSNTVGGVSTAARNVISGNANQGVTISDTGTNTNVIAGNFIGVNMAGATALGNAYAGVAIFNGAQSNVVGGSAFGAGNVISGNANQGITISGTDTNTNTVSGNLIGLDTTGLVKIGNTYGGVEIFGGAQSNLVGGTASGARNFIAGNMTYGIDFSGTGTNGNTAQGNTIGLNVAGTAITNGYQGLAIFGGAQGNLIGGTVPGAGNLISGNTASGGVACYDSTSIDNSIEENTIFSNGGSELSLYNGANHSLAAPAVTQAVLGLNTTVSGTLTATATNAVHRLEFFATPAVSTGGKVYIGTVNVTTNGSGAATFSVVLPPKVPAGSTIVATATDPAGNTSAFSAARTVTTTDSDGDGIPDIYETAHGLNPNNAADAKLDSDGDGMTNLQEYLAGTDPRNPASQLRVTALTRSGSNLTLGFMSVANQLYRLESTVDLTTPSSWRLQTDGIVGAGGVMSLTLTGAATEPKRFYRIDAEP